ncbi:MAG: thermonuclease family protein [Planctomycetota bacterium]
MNILDAVPDAEHVSAGEYKFRLAGVDASHSAVDARAFVETWIKNHDEYFKRVGEDEVEDMKDSQGLYLIWVQCGCHRELLNEALVREGLAQVREEPGQKLKYVPQMREAIKARNGK